MEAHRRAVNAIVNMLRTCATALGVITMGLALGIAWSQEPAGTTPCCGKVCTEDDALIMCGDVIPGGLGTLSGCAGIDDAVPATCIGGQFLDQPDMALLDGCACLLGACFGPISAGAVSLTPQQCTAAAVSACEEAGNVVITPDAGCSPLRVEDCDNGVDDDEDSMVDCADPDCANAPPCQPAPTPTAAATPRPRPTFTAVQPPTPRPRTPTPTPAPGSTSTPSQKKGGGGGGCTIGASAQLGANGWIVVAALWLATRRRRR